MKLRKTRNLKFEIRNQDRDCFLASDRGCVPSDYSHGSLDLAELQRLGLNPEQVLDFSANINPYGPSEAVRTALASVPLECYPDRDCLALRNALASLLRVSHSQILPGNGVCELIWLTALALLLAGDRVLVLGPTFCEYTRAAKLTGARVTAWRAKEETGFVLEPAEIVEQLRALRPRLAFLCNPNNPTGAVLEPGMISAWARENPRTLFVVDEAYLPFATGLGSALDFAEDNLFVLRSMTKDFGLAGLRLGYAVGQESLISSLRQAQPPWSVNALAQAAGVAALGDPVHRQKTLDQLAVAKQHLVEGLARLDLPPLSSATHFFLVRSPKENGAAFRQTLLERGMVVRDCASFGLPAYIRIATRRPDENERLLAAIREVI